MRRSRPFHRAAASKQLRSSSMKYSQIDYIATPGIETAASDRSHEIGQSSRNDTEGKGVTFPTGVIIPNPQEIATSLRSSQ
jgi:hypothetical protein